MPPSLPSWSRRTPLDKRLNVAFSINARKELTATVHDNLTGQDIYVDMPLVALR